jgi:hypothetical protein
MRHLNSSQHENMADSEDYLKKLLDDALKKHTKRKDVVRRISWSLKISTMLLGMTATIILGMSFKEDSAYIMYSRNGALICTALSTFLAGLASLWNIDHYWVKRKVIVSQLEALVEEFEFRRTMVSPMQENQIRGYFKRYQDIVEQQTEYWEEMLARASQTTISSPDTSKLNLHNLHVQGHS